MGRIKVLNIQTLSYSGTTWLNLLLGSHPEAFAFGPPHRAWGLRDKKFEGACLVHGPGCEFWTRFGERWDGKENFFVALSRESGKRIFLMDNAQQDFINATMSHPDVELLHGRYVRDGRAITASFARKMRSKGMTYRNSIMPDGWFYPSFQGIPLLATLKSMGHLVVHYEDAVRNQAAFLKAAGDFLGVQYDDSAYRFWEADHHLTVGNLGPITMVRLAHGLSTANFESADVYREQLERLKDDPTATFSDERWKTQLSREELFWFDQILGGKNEQLGYERDVFTQDEIERFAHDGLADSAFAAKIPADTLKALKKIKAPTKAADKTAQPSTPPPAADVVIPAPTATTSYTRELDRQRLAALKPYKVSNGAMNRSQIASMINTNFFAAYGPNFKDKSAAHISVDPLFFYGDLLRSIKADPRVRFATIRDAIARPPTVNEIVCTIRHDVDGDLVAAGQQAELENSLGIRTSYYLLHTAPYYGLLVNDVLQRNKDSVQDYLRIQSLGHELALHTDGMTLIQDKEIDGATAIRNEIAWLRENGCDIRGTTAHNSFGVYGCSNYSIFKGRPLALSTPGGPMGVFHKGRWAPLQILDEAELGLEYEANELFWQTETPLLYGCLMTQNNWYIADNQYGLLSPETKASRLPARVRYGTHNDMIDAIRALDGPAYVKLVVHPMHYGLRVSGTHSPYHREAPFDGEIEGCRVWAGGGENGAVSSVALNFPNEFGVLDRGLDCYSSGDFRILVLGGKQVASRKVSADSKFAQVAARLVRGPIRKPNAIAISCAGETVDSATLKKALADCDERARPDVIVLVAGMSDADIEAKKNLANEFVAQGRNVIVLVESNASSDAAAAGFPSSVMLTSQDAFEGYQGTAALHWYDSEDWTPQAHFLVASALARVLIKQATEKASQA